jgi:two-component system, LuxR family, response regulator FixJ
VRSHAKSGVVLEEINMPHARRQRLLDTVQKPICIVDDDDAVADSLRALLESFGFSVRSYSSGSEFLADERCRAASCLLIDQHMPGMSGLDVIGHLQREGVRIPAILISGQLDHSTRELATRLGVCALVDKPFAAGRLVRLVQALSETN